MEKMQKDQLYRNLFILNIIIQFEALLFNFTKSSSDVFIGIIISLIIGKKKKCY